MVNITALARSGVGGERRDQEVDLAGFQRRNAGRRRQLHDLDRHAEILADQAR